MRGGSIISKKNSFGPMCRALVQILEPSNRFLLWTRQNPAAGVGIGLVEGEKLCKEEVKVSCQAQKLPAFTFSKCMLARVWRVAHRMHLLEPDEVARNGA
jgi:hypothetical protein